MGINKLYCVSFYINRYCNKQYFKFMCYANNTQEAIDTARSKWLSTRMEHMYCITAHRVIPSDMEKGIFYKV